MDSTDAMPQSSPPVLVLKKWKADQMTRHLHSLSIDVEVASLTMAPMVALAHDAIGCAFPTTYVTNDLDR